MYMWKIVVENLFKQSIHCLENLTRKKYKINDSDPEDGGKMYLGNGRQHSPCSHGAKIQDRNILWRVSPTQ
jgi:hypothetical protein